MAYSNDLRRRVVEAVAEGESRRSAAARFKVGVSSAIRWVARHEQTGDVSARSGGPRSPLEDHGDVLLALVESEPDITLEEVRARLLEERGHKAGIGSIWRFFDRHGISFKKKPSRRRAGSP